jgi:hypothetical protein
VTGQLVDDRTSDPEGPRRAATLEDLHLLDTGPEARFDRVVRLAQHIFGVPYVAVNLISDDRHYTKAAAGGGDLPGPGASLALSDSLCAITVQDDRTLEIPDLHAADRWSAHPAAREGVGYYAGEPLHAPGGQRVGSLCLIDVEPRPELSAGEQAVLRDLAGWVERELATSADLQQGAELQRRLLPRGLPDLPGWDVAGRCLQAGAVGGDFYDWQVLGDGRVQVLLADVMGKGIQAALLASGVRAIVRGTSPHNSLAASVQRLADDMVDDLTEISSFVTMFAARLTPADGTVEYVDAGHGLAFLVGADRDRPLATTDLPLGALPDLTWEPHQAELGPGDALVVVSDGMLDIHEDRAGILAAVRAAHAATTGAADLVDRLVDTASGRSTTDDLTVVVVRRSA